MTNKDYKQLYTELLKENKILKLEIEAMRCIINNQDDGLTYLTKLINNVVSKANHLNDENEQLEKHNREYSKGMYAEMEEEVSKIK